MDRQRQVLVQSLVLTVLIFAAGIVVNHFFDEARLGIINDVLRAHEIDSDAYQVEQLFTQMYGGNQCEVMSSRIGDLKKEIRKVGEDLGSYSRFSFFRRHDYDYLKRQYFLLEFRFLALIERLNKECGNPYLPVIFFYEIDDEDSERQGFILEDLSEEYDSQLVVLSLDKDYSDEPLVGLLAKSYNVSASPTMIIGGERFEGLRYTGELNASFQKFLRRADPFAKSFDFMYTPTAAGLNVSTLLIAMESIRLNESADPFARGDAALIMGRLTKNESMICSALGFYDNIQSSDPMERAILAETSASLGCGRNRQAFLRLASNEWALAGVSWRSELMGRLGAGERFVPRFDEVALKANATVISGYVTPILSNLSLTNASQVIIGETGFVVDSSSIVVSQNDRVLRDWLGGQLQNPFKGELLTTFSERLSYNSSELRPEIGWHEGARLKELIRTNASYSPAVGTLVAKTKGRWFASDEKGVFRFEVPLDKVLYPTTRFLRSDLAVIIDSHGVNMLVDDALRSNATVVIGCCDHPGKIYAADYLSRRGVSVICLTDKYLYLALGHNISAAGSPPLKDEGARVLVGNRPISIPKDALVVAVNSTSDAYALWYYQTPASYVEALSSVFPLNVSYVELTQFNQMNRAVDKARSVNASVMFTRVFNSDDYAQIKAWLDEDQSRKVFLFHSASYPYGKLLLDEFPDRASFDDPNPVFIK
ncbi:hypothetical protein J4219_09350 [Candidatus Woesearchaeota archaeon]|nr:hypothetical protein [Candidatus Woesearchaeota archaeon]